LGCVADIIQLSAKRPKSLPRRKPKQRRRRKLRKRARRNVSLRGRPRTHDDLQRKVPRRARKMRPREENAFAVPSRSLI
jgi:hypothetical protein